MIKFIKKEIDMDNKSIKFKWESDAEYKYRRTMYLISANISKLLATLGEYDKQTNPNYYPCLNKIKSEHGRLKNLKVPDLYDEIHRLLSQGYDYYEMSFFVLIDAFKTKLIVGANDNKLAGKVAKAASFIETGNAFTKIVNTKLFEILERKQEEYLKKEAK
jgi:hypothetical protein